MSGTAQFPAETGKDGSFVRQMYSIRDRVTAGRALVEECIRRARRMGARDLGLHTSRSMAVAMELYRRMGFIRWPETDFQPEGAELVEGYRLPLGENGAVTAPG